MASPPDPSSTPCAVGPHRTCIGCRRVRAAAELDRLTRAGDGTLRFGRTLPGRGAWLCRASPECFELAAKRGGFARAFRAPVRAPEVDALRVGVARVGSEPRTPFVPGPPAARD